MINLKTAGVGWPPDHPVSSVLTALGRSAWCGRSEIRLHPCLPAGEGTESGVLLWVGDATEDVLDLSEPVQITSLERAVFKGEQEEEGPT